MKAKVRQLRTELKTTKKGTRIVTEYVLRIKTIFGCLVAIGDAVNEQDQVDAILEGLPEEYGPFVMMMYGRSDSPSVSDVESLLLLQESQLEKYKSEFTATTVSVNVAQGPQGSVKSQSSGFNFDENQTENRGGRSWRGRGGRNNCGRGRGRYGSGPKPTCQLCFKYDHDAFNCWNRFDEYFVQPKPPSNIAEQGHPYAFSQPANIVNSYQAPRPPPPSSQFQPQQARAYVTTQLNMFQPETQEFQVSQSFDNNWYPDSGASHHVTPNSSNFTQQTTYKGPEQVHVGNGQGLEIKSVGSAAFTTPHHPHITLTLHNMLLVPKITKTLVSVSQFAKDNKVYFEFHSDCCYVKCKITHQILLQGDIASDGLYCFKQLHMTHTTPRNVSCLVSATTCNSDFELWHRRLGDMLILELSKLFWICVMSQLVIKLILSFVMLAVWERHTNYMLLLLKQSMMHLLNWSSLICRDQPRVPLQLDITITSFLLMLTRDSHGCIF